MRANNSFREWSPGLKDFRGLIDTAGYHAALSLKLQDPILWSGSNPAVSMTPLYNTVQVGSCGLIDMQDPIPQSH
jgi:hypothetical protein